MAVHRSGISKEVADAIEDAGEVPAVQPLLPLVDAEAAAAAIDAGRIGSMAIDEARKAGRPRGSRNKRTEQFRQFILARYAHPGEALAATYSRPVDALAAELGCTRLEAAQMQIKAAAELLPYIESKMPVAVGVSAEGQIQLILATGGGDGARQIVDGGTLTGLSLMAAGIEEKQGDSEA